MNFLGLTNYCRRFVPDYSAITKPLTLLTRADVPFHWTDSHTAAFERLKTALTSAPVLRIFDPKLPIRIQTDASQYAYGAVLLQDDDSGARPVAYASKQFNAAQQNYITREQELLGIVLALTEFDVYLHGSPFVVESDHHTLQTLLTQPKLSRRLARWTDFLSEYDLQIVYRPGATNLAADALSRRPDLATPVVAALAETTLQLDPVLSRDIVAAYPKDPAFNRIVHCLANGHALPPESGNHYVLNDAGLLFYTADEALRLCVPNDAKLRAQLMTELHDGPTSGHLGYYKTYLKARALFYWPRMDTFIKNYVARCPICQRIKPSTQTSTWSVTTLAGTLETLV